MDDLWKIILGIVVLIAAIFFLLNALPTTASNKEIAGTIEEPGGMKAPELAGISSYINSEPFTLSKYVGKKVILVDFWTYTCINCIRTLPYLKSWDDKYASQGLLIVGVHSPEFEFEKELENVKAAVAKYGLEYPVVLDNEHATWKAYQNNYWPRKYLIDKNGNIIYDHIGEGGYEETERQIVAALNELNEKDIVVSSAKVNATDVNFGQIGTPELYFGFKFRRDPIGNAPAMQWYQKYDFGQPADILPNLIYLSGSWFNYDDNMALAGNEGKIILQYKAKVVNLVMAGDATAEVYLDGQKIDASIQGNDVIDGTVKISEERLYNLVNGNDYSAHTLELRIKGKPGEFKAYAFTFG